MLQKILNLDKEILIWARSIAPIEYAPLIQFLGEIIVIWGGTLLVILWLYSVKKKTNIYKIISLKIFFVVILTFILYGLINFGLPQDWRPSPQKIAGTIAPLIPHPIDNSFPSGHALFSASLLVGIIFFFPRKGIIIISIILGIITTSARVIAGVHYPGDILGGLLFGSIGGIFWAKIVTTGLFQKVIFPFIIGIAKYIKL